jgi:hypothetical protein
MLLGIWIMNVYFLKKKIRTADYLGSDRRIGNDRRETADRRTVVRFDLNGGDRRRGFARRSTDVGFREQDFSWFTE